MGRFDNIRTGTTGSYLGFYFASCITTAMFGGAMTWHFITESLFFDLVKEQYSTLAYIIFAWACMGWLMCLIVGIGFDVLPLIHGSSPFHQESMRQFLLTNVFGQALLFASTFMDTVERIEEFATLGIAFLALAVFLLGKPGRDLYTGSEVKPEGDEVGIMSFAPGLALPFFAGLVLICWFLRGSAGMLDLGMSIMVMFYMMLTIVIVVSHFNRRLNWSIVHPKRIPLQFGIFFALSALHVLFSFLAGREDAGTNTLLTQMKNYSMGLAFLFAFLICNPVKIAKKAWTGERMAHNQLIFAALWILPFSAFHAFNSGSYLDRPGTPGHTIFISTSALLAVWGYAQYLHLDHLHINIHKRKTNIPFMLCFLTGFIAIQVLFIKNWLRLGSTEVEQSVWIVSLTLGALIMMFNFTRQTMLSFDTWHRIPMFYGRYNQPKSKN